VERGSGQQDDLAGIDQAGPEAENQAGLPAPLRLRVDGTIVGKPKTPGAYALEVEVVDADGIRNGATVMLRVVRP